MPPARTNIEKRIEKEKQRITELRLEIERSESFVKGLQEALQMLPKEKPLEPSRIKNLRPGSDIEKIRDLIRQIGHPLLLDEIIDGIGKEVTNASRASIASSLSRYVRKGEIFNRPGPNKFGLLEQESVELPDTFGSEEKAQDLPFS